MNETVAAYGVAGKIITIGTFMFMGFGAGLQPLVGYNYGSKLLTAESHYQGGLLLQPA